MPNEDSDYKREEDRKWRERVDYEQIAIKTAHQVISDRLDELQDKLEEIDDLLRGDPVQQTDGIVEQLHGINAHLSKLNSTVFMDSTGKRGLAHDVEILMGRKRDRDFRSEEGWKSSTKILVAIIGAASLLVTSLWKDIKPLIPIFQDPKPVATKLKHPKKPIKAKPALLEPLSDGTAPVE